MLMLRVGIIGCGAISVNRHAPEYARHPQVEIAAYYDRHKDRAEYLVQKYGGRVFDSYESLIDVNGIDAVSICTSNDTHYPIAIAALEKGKHVLCEKPMAMNLQEARLMVSAAKKSDRKLMIAFNQRFAPAHRKAKEMIQSGLLGRILTFETSIGHAGPEFWAATKGNNTWFFDKERSGSGVIGDLGVHKIDLLRYLLEDEYDTVFAIGGTLNKKDICGTPIPVLDNAKVLFQTIKGVLGSASFSWTRYGKKMDNSTHLSGEKGILEILDEYTIKYYTPEDSTIQTINFPQEEYSDSGVIEEFVNSIRESRQPSADSVAGIRSLQVVLAILKSIESKEFVRLNYSDSV
jgi:predicted dehydrogenase